MTERQWWALQWLDLLEKYRFKKRLERGRNYAREGNILSIDFEGAKVTADVQGTADEPYHLWIKLDRFSDEDWNYVIQSLAEKAIFSAQLLAGEMPENIEEVFIANGLSLFPFSLSDVHSRCNCPDPKNPCKHIAAVYYELADRFSEDPFVLFQLRGRTRSEILEQIREIRQQNAAGITEPVAGEETVTPTTSEETPEERSQWDIETFWQYDQPLDSALVQMNTETDQTVLEILGSFPLPGTEAQAVQQYLEQVQKQVHSEIVHQANP
ncbi:MAG: SWIM zinc finger family protein [Halothece sp. Uz-M2-17]|nr:SWIM zinc finger family protein [Halothece sp. Uz-M2-17]